jgi:hypothetical protein
VATIKVVSGLIQVFFKRLLNACWEIPKNLAARDWFPPLLFMASSINRLVACLIVGSWWEKVINASALNIPHAVRLCPGIADVNMGSDGLDREFPDLWRLTASKTMDSSSLTLPG